jgi:hypothetical protein
LATENRASRATGCVRAHFPQYDYDDMVRAQYDLLTQGWTSIICG